jgi:hypothetical protein
MMLMRTLVGFFHDTEKRQRLHCKQTLHEVHMTVAGQREHSALNDQFDEQLQQQHQR